MKRNRFKAGLVCLIVVIALTVLAGCGKVTSQQSSAPSAETEESAGQTGTEVAGEESEDADQSSDYVEDYVIEVDEDEKATIK